MVCFSAGKGVFHGSHAMQSAVLEVVPNGHKDRKQRTARRVFLQGAQQIKGLPETDHKSNPKKKMKLGFSQA